MLYAAQGHKLRLRRVGRCGSRTTVERFFADRKVHLDAVRSICDGIKCGMVIKTGILCIPEFDDLACLALRRLLTEQVVGAVVMIESVARSHRNWIEEILRRWCDEEELDLVLTLGGTLPAPGPSANEVTPEATLAVIERQMPGVPEAMRAYAQEKTVLALLDRGVAGIRGRTLIVNLPEGAAPAVLFLESVVAVVPAIIAHLQGDLYSPRLADAVELSDDRGADSASVDAVAVRPALAKELKADEFAAFLLRSAAGHGEK